MIKYAWAAIVLCALAGCGKTPPVPLDEQQDEVNDDAMAQEKKQPMLIRSGTDPGGARLCTLAVDPPAVRYERILSAGTRRFGCRGRGVAVSGAAVREVKLEVFRFGFSPSIMLFKKGERVRLLATSRDVLHGVSLKEYRINVPVRRGEVRKIEFVADTAGEFIIRCPINCGRGYNHMMSRIVVEE